MQFIYKILFPNNKVYIGRTKDIKRRWQSHKRHAKKSGVKNILYSAMFRYGTENLKLKIIEEVEKDEEVYEREIYWIEQYNSTDKNFGYNVSKGGKDLWYGEKTHIDEERWKDIQQRRLKTLLENGYTNSGKNNPMSFESISKRYGVSIEEAHKYTPIYGKKRSEHVKQRASETHKGKIVSQETREKNSKYHIKYEYTIENITTGEKIQTENLYKWCKINNVDYQVMMRKSRGDTINSYKHKNFKVSRVLL